ncbi:MAG: hypothetical protein OXH68_15230 [Gammaproteobacteria bacterium]|nr:hypothetical protein [Gammaproteobacteria bacterium]
MATVADVLNIAYARNKRAQRGKDATDEELFEVITEVMGRYVAEGQRVNRAWFTEEELVPVNTTLDGWPRPDRAESVHRIATPAGERVAKVPYDKQGVEPYKPAVYRIGRLYRPVPSNAPGRLTRNPLYPEPDSRQQPTLTFYYTQRPQPVDALSTELDPMWPDGHETLLGIEVALFLSRKDNRTEDYPALEMQREEQAARFFRFLEHEDPGVVDPGRRAYKWSIPRAAPVTGEAAS